MIEISDSDDDDCQLYTKTAEHFITKRNELQAKRRELEEIIDLLPDDEYEKVLLSEENFTKRPLFEDAKSPKKKCNQDLVSVNESPINVKDISDSEDDISLAELRRRSLRSNKRCNKSPPTTQRKRSKRSSRRRNNKQNSTSTSQVRNHSVIILDDDTGYPMDTLPPIDFNSRSRLKSRTSSGLENISLDSILNEDSGEDDLMEKNDVVKIIIEWSNSQKTTRKEFKLRRFQKFESIFEDLAKMENISTNRVLLMYDFKSISPMDTPSSLNLKFYGALVGSVSASEVNHSKVNLNDENYKNNSSGPMGGIQVKLLLQSKQTLLFTVLKHQKIDILYTKCAEEIKCEKSKLKLTFDGEYVEPMELVSDLDIEDGDVIHVHIKD